MQYQEMTPEQNQLLDYMLIDEIAQDTPSAYQCAKNLMRKIQVEGKKSKLDTVSWHQVYSRVGAIYKGTRTLQPASCFQGRPGNRTGKNQNYAGFWTLVDAFIADKQQRHYLGLAANQLDIVCKHVYGSVVVCETNKVLYQKLEKLSKFLGTISKEGPSTDSITIYNQNIWKGDFGDSANIIDLDLMSALPDVQEVAKHIKYWSEQNSAYIVVMITVPIGHHITEKEYHNEREFLKCALEQEEFYVTAESLFKYRDHRIPMRSQRLVLKRR